MSTSPSSEVVEAIEAGTTAVTRRAEIYEYDGQTRWDPDDYHSGGSSNDDSDDDDDKSKSRSDDDNVSDDSDSGSKSRSRLISGSVSIDYTREERRSLDIVLDNRDQALRPDAYDGMWYDKIIKCYRGVRYPTSKLPPKVVIIEEETSNSGYTLRNYLSRLGFTRTVVKSTVTKLSEIRDYDFVVSYMPTTKTAKSTLLVQAFDAGKNVISVGINNTPTEIPLLTNGLAGQNQEFGLYNPGFDTPAAGGWANEAGAVVTGYRPGVAAGAGARVVAYLSAAVTYPAALIKESGSGARWFHYHRFEFGSQALAFWGNVLNWMRDYRPYKNWEVQVGEFMIDNLSESHFPHHLKVTGRDYTKKCMLSKLERSMAFLPGLPVAQLVRDVAANAGITKFRIPAYETVLDARVDAERGTPRWQLMNDVASAHNFELFFDAQGYLVMREFIDPSFGPVSWTFKTGLDGNIANFDRSTNDSRIFNHVVVTGEREDDSGAMPYFGQARNKEPSSPTRIERLGDRMTEYSSPFFTSNKQCRQFARSMLKVHALESYEINWQSFNYPWLEGGEVVKFLDPERTSIEPTRYLMDTLTIPLDLGPMSATGKRVTFIDDPDIADEDDNPNLEED